MAWLKIEQTFATHRKTYRLAETLRIHPMQAAGHVLALWSWALDNAPTGDLRGAPDRALADAARWTAKPAAFVMALRQAGFLDGDVSAYTLHDWDDYSGAFADTRAADAAKKRRQRQRRRATLEGGQSLGTGGQCGGHIEGDIPPRIPSEEQSRVEKPPVVPLGKGDGAARREAARKAQAQRDLDAALAMANYIDPIDPTLPADPPNA